MRFRAQNNDGKSGSVPFPKSFRLGGHLEMKLHFADRSLKKAV